MATPQTDFGGLAGGAQPPPEAYTGLTAVDGATDHGEYKQNRPDINKPWTLPVYRPPDIRPIG
jgi:hypothetical protein